MKSDNIQLLTEAELQELGHKINIFFTQQLLLILNDPFELDEAVRTTGTCNIKDVPASLTEFENAFDVNDNLKKYLLPENYELRDYNRTEDEIASYGLNGINLTDKQKLKLSGAIMQAGLLTAKEFENVTNKYGEGALNEEMQTEMTQVLSMLPNPHDPIQIKKTIETLGGGEILKRMTSKDIAYQENKIKNELESCAKFCQDRPQDKEFLFTRLESLYVYYRHDDPDVILRILKEALNKETPLGQFFHKPRGGRLAEMFGKYETSIDKGTLKKINDLKNTVIKEIFESHQTLSPSVAKRS